MEEESDEEEASFGVFGVRLRQHQRPTSPHTHVQKGGSFKFSEDDAESEALRPELGNSAKHRAEQGSGTKAPITGLHFFSIPSTTTLQPTSSSHSFSPMLSVSAEGSLLSRQNSEVRVSRQNSENIVGQGSDSPAPRSLGKGRSSHSAKQQKHFPEADVQQEELQKPATKTVELSVSLPLPRASSAATLQRARSHGRNRDMYKPISTPSPSKPDRNAVKKGFKNPRKYPDHRPEYYLEGATGYGRLVHAVASGMQGTSTFTYKDCEERYYTNRARSPLASESAFDSWSAMHSTSRRWVAPVKAFTPKIVVPQDAVRRSYVQDNFDFFENPSSASPHNLGRPRSSTGLFCYTPSRFDSHRSVQRRPSVPSRAHTSDLAVDGVSSDLPVRPHSSQDIVRPMISQRRRMLKGSKQSSVSVSGRSVELDLALASRPSSAGPLRGWGVPHSPPPSELPLANRRAGRAADSDSVSYMSSRRNSIESAVSSARGGTHGGGGCDVQKVDIALTDDAVLRSPLAHSTQMGVQASYFKPSKQGSFFFRRHKMMKEKESTADEPTADIDEGLASSDSEA